MGKNPANRYITYPVSSILVITSKRHGVHYVLFDTEDYNRIKHLHWNVEKDAKGKFYVRNSKLKLKLHRLIMETPEDSVVDHLNHNTLDNRKVNLKNCTVRENNQNVNPMNKYPNRTTGEYGLCCSEVTYKNGNKIYKYWRFIVQVKGSKTRHFKTKNEALIYRNECLRKRGL